MSEQTYLLALGGLLHDIGKFALRAGVGGGRIWDDEAQSDYGYKHASLSADFLRDDVPAPWNSGVAYQGVALHHRPQGRAALIVAVADRLSAGEREKAPGAEPLSMRPILTRLLKGAPGEWYWPLSALRAEREILFPREGVRSGSPEREYKALWDEFAAQARILKEASAGEEADLATYLASLQHLLLRYTWCIPSAAYHAIPDVSLYDHSRMTAALAACLAGEDDETLQALVQAPENEREVALLVGGDISGVQDFIYTITPRGALPALRGRSFYLQLLTEAVATYLLRRLELPPTSLIYAGGGHMYLLAPRTAAPKVAEVQEYISRLLLQHHGGDLYLALAYRPLAGKEFFAGRLAKAWQDLSERLRRAKDRRFAELGEAMHGLVFAAGQDQGNQERECQVCHHEHPETKEVSEGEEAPEWRKCPACRAFEDLGDSLRRAKYLYLEEIPPVMTPLDQPAGTYRDVLAALGLRVRLMERPPAEVTLAPDALRAQMLALEDAALGRLRPAPRLAIGRQWLVNVTPEKDGRVISNDELAEASRGIERLGILRMDVDNLGRLFGEGLGELATLSRVASLSLAIRLFFEGWVEALAQEMNRGAKVNGIYSIYSGGDDLFFVGAWDAMVSLAQRIAADFAAFAGQNPSVHLSGGLVLVEGTYPIYLAAREAKEAEDQAKGLPGKKAFSFLGRALPWDIFERAAKEAEKLDGWVCDKKAPRSLLRLLMRAQEAYEAMVERQRREGATRTMAGEPQGYYGPWIPRLEYMLARLAEREKAIAAELGALRDRLREDAYRSIGWIGLAARWAELLNRERKEKQDDKVSG